MAIFNAPLGEMVYDDDERPLLSLRPVGMNALGNEVLFCEGDLLGKIAVVRDTQPAEASARTLAIELTYP